MKHQMNTVEEYTPLIARILGKRERGVEKKVISFHISASTVDELAFVAKRKRLSPGLMAREIVLQALVEYKGMKKVVTKKKYRRAMKAKAVAQVAQA